MLLQYVTLTLLSKTVINCLEVNTSTYYYSDSIYINVSVVLPFFDWGGGEGGAPKPPLSTLWRRHPGPVEHSVTSKHFSFGGQFCEHTVGMACGISTISSYHQLLDGRFQGEYSRTNDIDKPLCFFHYVDDTFVIWQYRPEELEWFLYHLNGFHRNIYLTLWRQKRWPPSFFWHWYL